MSGRLLGFEVPSDLTLCSTRKLSEMVGYRGWGWYRSMGLPLCQNILLKGVPKGQCGTRLWLEFLKLEDYLVFEGDLRIFAKEAEGRRDFQSSLSGVKAEARLRNDNTKFPILLLITYL
jgi:hypothetical protein